MPFLDPERQSYYRHWECPDPQATVVLLHGFGEHGNHLHRVAHALNGAGLDVWAPDLWGHGLSGGPRGQYGSVESLADQTEALIDVVEQARPGRPVFLVGHSLGGVTAATVACRGRHIAGMVLTGAPLSGLLHDVPDDAVMSEEPFYVDALAVDPLKFDTAPHEPALWQDLADSSPRLRRDVGELAVPVLLVYGDKDAFTTADEARRWAERFPNATITFVPGHHDILNDLSHAEVASLIETFILSHCRDVATAS